ncbi:hypothetical protein BOX15_Mlig017148g2, partial [Macrostomum lignano]
LSDTQNRQMSSTEASNNSGVNGTEAASSRSLLRRIVDFLDEADWSFKKDKDRPIVKFISPDSLMSEYAEMLGLPDKPVPEDVLLDNLKTVYDLSVTSNHPRFYNQLFGRVHEESVVGSLLTDAINASIYTYEVAPVFTVMERLAMQQFLELFGFQNGEGVCTPGGSIGNMYAISLAKSAVFPDARRLGLAAMPPAKIYVSMESHYSMVKGASFMGFGENAVVKVATDEHGRMKVDALREHIKSDIENGQKPLMVVATAGTTVLGVYDPISEVANVCQEFNVWLHVDGCLGGSAILSESRRHLLDGCQRADSLTWNPHKMLGVNLQCSLLLTRHSGALQRAHGTQAAYLFQQDKFYPPQFDIGDKVIQCGRKVDVLKLWAVWRGLGKSGLGDLVDRKFTLAKQLANLIAQRQKTDGSFELIAEPESTNVLFWYIPPALRGQPADWSKRDDSWWRQMDAVAPLLKKRMTLDGSMLIGYQKCAASKNINCWRMVCSQDTNSEQDMERIVGEFCRFGEDISV